ncbi:kinase-like domain-containing protein [Talaromyces proteolyticus]|uniref:non-specific serine/threonine protein kinase n=1 Tax=Talaromyces proteolyticus TaxID=1131652 RepID=A0AAD4KFH8_9EURO|nr:kinase-like domain-containing protein [Talaromyces proteolyticus]KAH8690747.1 kinase-like domain-containing protein [Talaromyces proteolyticus]
MIGVLQLFNHLTCLISSLPLLRRRWTPLNQEIKEETIPDYYATRYYPTQIGETFKNRYQVVRKLGFGASSTVWLKRMGEVSQKHSGHKYVRPLLDSFDMDGPEDKHRCLMYPPFWESLLAILFRNLILRLHIPVFVVVLHRLFLVLDYLHTGCKIIHTNIKTDNIMFGIADDSVFSDFEENELQNTCPRKELDRRTIYISRKLGMSKKLGAPALCDFGSAVLVPWTYSVDIWNVRYMIWNIFEGGFLFKGQDPEFQTYWSRARLAEMIRLLGPQPPDLLARGNLTRKFFSVEGNFYVRIPVQEYTPLEERRTTFEGQETEQFRRLEPRERSSAKES